MDWAYVFCVVPIISFQNLQKGKLYAYSKDNSTVVFIFESVEQAASELTPNRCAHLSDIEISQKKNIRHIRRVINKGVLTTTEKGQFYLYQNLNSSTCLALEVWGKILPSSLGIRNISKEERDMIKLPSFQHSVTIGLLLSDGWFGCSQRKNVNLFFKQSLDHSAYVWFVFSILSHYCSSYPNLVSGIRSSKRYYALEFFTRALPCFTEIYSLFYVDKVKIVPHNIYELLTPPALAHFIMGDGAAKSYGLTLCTDSFSLVDIVRIMNVLVIRYDLKCSLHLKRKNQYRIYIFQHSMPLLRTIVTPYFYSSMLYKLGL